MKIHKPNFLIILLLTFVIVSVQGQPWVKLMDKTDKASFEEARNQFRQFWANKALEKGKGYKPFLRWEHSFEHHQLPNGSLAPAGTTDLAFKAYQAAALSSPTGNWTSLGPTSSTGGYAGVGRINCIAFEPANANTIYIGSAGGGVWKTTNGGTAWTALTDFQASLGASSLLVEPTNGSIIYLATGDGDGKDSPSTGVLKSTDGGNTWNPTGLNWIRSDLRYIRKLVRHASNANLIIAATSVGIYRTLDAGVSWTQEATGNFYDAEFQPGSASNFYASALSASSVGEVHRSTDNGDTWAIVHTLAACSRVAIAVSAANTNFIGALYSKSSDNGFNGFYSSTNGGTSWAVKSTTPNLLGWNATGNDAGGQGWYDLAVIADPTNANTIYIGGVNTWKSTNGGTSWTINTMWTNSGSVPVVHADKHALEFQNNTTLFQGNDGGIYKTTNGGTSWTDLTNTLVISQLYRLGGAQTNATIIGGLQDNGTKMKNTAGTWTDEIGGDGMDCAINPTNANYMYGELYYGDLYRSTNAGGSWSSIKPRGTEQGGWITPFAISASTPATLYLGYKNIFKTTNYGTKWTKMTTNLTGGINIRALAIAPSSASIVYCSADADLASGNRLYKTTNGGTSWATMTNPTNVGRIASITIDNLNANNVWAVISGYNAGQKIFTSTNGGTTWTNVSGTLPNIPANCATYWNGSNGAIYLGMDMGVYYKDNTMSDWALFNTSLPNVEIADLEIQYSLGKLRAATYGRGVWESDLFGTSAFILPGLAKNYSPAELEKANFRVYPNPVKDILNIEFYSSIEGETHLYLIDVLGRISQQQKTVTAYKGFNSVQINVATIPAGIYYLGNGQGKSIRFLKE